MSLANGYQSYITRSQYKKIKQYDRQQMDEFIGHIYAKAYDEGFAKGCKVGRDDINAAKVKKNFEIKGLERSGCNG